RAGGSPPRSPRSPRVARPVQLPPAPRQPRPQPTRGAGRAFMPPIVLSLSGQLDLGDSRLSRTDARDWLARAAVWFEGVGDAVLDAQLVRDGEGRPVLLVVLHPTSPAVEVRLGGSGRLRVTAVTPPAGPGSHQHLCGLLRPLGRDLALPWVADDCSAPTGYFAARHRAAL